jgi:hypothetical protein
MGRLYSYLYRLLIIFSIFLLACSKKPAIDEDTVLVIGNETISIETFRNYYEFDPSFPGYLKGIPGLQEYAELVIDKILCQQLALQENLFQRIEFKRRLNYQTQKASLQLLFKQQISQNIQVNEEELPQTLLQMSKILELKHLFTPDSVIAQILYDKLNSGENFDSLAKQIFRDVPPEKGGADLGEVRWGDLDPALEKAAFDLKTGEYSLPVKSQWGYHILFLVNQDSDGKLTEIDFARKREKILKKLIARKERIASDDYLKNYLTPLDIRVKKEAFRKIVNTLELGEESSSAIQLIPIQYLTDQKLSFIKNELNSDSEQIFMTSRSGQWTIGDFFEHLDQLPFEQRPKINSVRTLQQDIGLLIRNDFLFKEAEKRQLDQSSYVDSVVQSYSREVAYQYYLKTFYSDYALPAEITSYYHNKSNQQLPATVLPGMNTVEDYRYYYAARSLHQYLMKRFKTLSIKINHEFLKNEVQLIDWNTPIRMSLIPND